MSSFGHTSHVHAGTSAAGCGVGVVDGGVKVASKALVQWVPQRLHSASTPETTRTHQRHLHGGGFTGFFIAFVDILANLVCKGSAEWWLARRCSSPRSLMAGKGLIPRLCNQTSWRALALKRLSLLRAVLDVMIPKTEDQNCKHPPMQRQVNLRGKWLRAPE